MTSWSHRLGAMRGTTDAACEPPSAPQRQAVWLGWSDVFLRHPATLDYLARRLDELAAQFPTNPDT